MKINKIEKITREKWLNLYAADFENRGHAGRWIYASRQPQPVAERRADAVLIVPLLLAPPAPPRLVLIKEFRVPVGDWIYGFPAGLLEEGESVKEAANREMLEETGLRVTKVTRTSPILFSSAGLTDEAIRMVHVEVKARAGSAAQLDRSEEIEVALLDFADVCKLCDDRNALMDAKVWTTLVAFQRLGRLE